MNEAILNFTNGKEDMATEEGKKFSLEILDFMRDILKVYQEETGNLYNLEATPAEGTTYRFAKKDKEVYPNIIVANDEAVKKGADPYYTNSTHLPVNYTNDIFEALELQDELQTKYTGGTVLHGFLGQKISDPEAAKALVKKIVYGYHLPYFTITPTFSICPKHGYLAGEHKFCPKCDEELGYREMATDVSVGASPVIVAKGEEMAIRSDIGFIAEAVDVPLTAVAEVEEQLVPETATVGHASNERNIINAIA